MFGVGGSPKYIGICSCDDIRYGNMARVKTTLSPGLVAMIQGWDAFCIIKDYDKIAKEEAEKEEGNGRYPTN